MNQKMKFNPRFKYQPEIYNYIMQEKNPNYLQLPAELFSKDAREFFDPLKPKKPALVDHKPSYLQY